ncbi:hypothetical protein L2E82_11673 [Cichorium intybus]|uniref:Uncharacterized protein n=1 Tax=Cichorium intybus TaxID=13427 RepID=A0ACB9GF32_CICIN|nr:hypothetical protein L2E82_11673 [Cichorium intybus]
MHDQVKYLGEDGEDVPIAGAVAICSPLDLLIGSRFLCRGTVQKFYDRPLTVGLQEYAQLLGWYSKVELLLRTNTQSTDPSAYHNTRFQNSETDYDIFSGNLSPTDADINGTLVKIDGDGGREEYGGEVLRRGTIASRIS